MKPVIVVDSINGVTGQIRRNVFVPEDSGVAHEWARQEVKCATRPMLVSLRMAHVNDDGYIFEGFKET